MKTGKLSLGTKVGYGFGQMGEGLAYNMFYFYYTYFMVSIVGISPAVAGTISALAVIWDAVTDPLIGFMSDQCTSKMGRRRSYISKGIIPLAISLFILYLDLPVSMTVRLVIAFVINIVFWVVFTMCDVSWISLGNELTDDMNETTQLRTISTVLLYCGNIIVSGFTLTAVTLISTKLSNPNLAWGIWALIIGILAACAFGIATYTTKGLDKPIPADTPKQSFAKFVPELIGCLKIKYYLPVALTALVMTTAYGIFSSGSVFLMTYVYGFNEVMQGTMNVVSVIAAMILTVILGVVATKGEKKTMYILTNAIGIVLFILAMFMPRTLPGYIVFAVAFAVGNAAFWTYIFALTGDVSTVDVLETGKQRVGLMTALVNFMTKLGTAIGMWLIGIGLTMVGYDTEATTQTAEVAAKIAAVIIIPLIILLVINIIVMACYKLTRGEYEAILAKHQK